MENNLIFNKERSVKACIADGWRIFALNRSIYLKNMWVYLLLAGLTGAFLSELCIQYICDHFLPAYRLTELDSDSELAKLIALPTLSETVYLLLAFVLFIMALYCCYGRMWRMMKHFSIENQLPRLSLHFSRDERSFALRMFGINMLFTIIFLILTAFVTAAALKWNTWISVALLPFFIYTICTVCVCEIWYVFKGASLKESLAYGLKHSMGIPFIIRFITFIPATALYVVCSMPPIVYALSEWAGYNSILMGDASGLPPFLPILFYVINTICLAISLLCITIRTWTLVLKI